MMNMTVRIGDLLTIGSTLVGMWLFSLGVVRTVNGKFARHSETLARIDERVKGVEADVARANTRIDNLAGG